MKFAHLHALLQTEEPMDSWAPEEQRHIVTMARRGGIDACDIILEMGLDPEQFSDHQIREIDKELLLSRK